MGCEGIRSCRSQRIEIERAARRELLGRTASVVIHATEGAEGWAIEARSLVDFALCWSVRAPDLFENTWLDTGYPRAMLDGDLVYAGDDELVRRDGETGQVRGCCPLPGRALGMAAARGRAVIGVLRQPTADGEAPGMDILALDVSQEFGRHLWSKTERSPSTATAERAIPYTRSQTFRTGQVMQHPDLGLGLVVAQLTRRKMLASFELGARELRCGEGSTGGREPVAIEDVAPLLGGQRYSEATICGPWVVAAYRGSHCEGGEVEATSESLALLSLESGSEHSFPGLAEYESLAGGRADKRLIVGYRLVAADDRGLVCEPDGWPEDVGLFEIGSSSAQLAWALPKNEDTDSCPTHWTLSPKCFVALVTHQYQPELHRLVAIERSSGEMLWQQDVEIDPEYDVIDNVRLAHSDDVLYVAWARPEISILGVDLHSGEELFSRSSFGFSYSDLELERRERVDLDLVPCDGALVAEVRTSQRSVLLRLDGCE